MYTGDGTPYQMIPTMYLLGIVIHVRIVLQIDIIIKPLYRLINKKMFLDFIAGHLK